MPLHGAVSKRTVEVVAMLLGIGADPTVRDSAGKSPWDYAKSNSFIKETDAWRQLRAASE